MSVTVDREPMAAEQMGMRTVGQVLTHVQRENRLVVNLLIDGQMPDLTRMGHLKAAPLDGHTLFIETAAPREIALDVIGEMDAQLRDTDRLRTEAVDLLQRNQPAQAMERLSGCFSSWHSAQESVCKTAQLLRIDLDSVRVGDQTLNDLLTDFAEQLKQIKAALEDRDFVTLSDILAYEATQTSSQWHQALDEIRQRIDGD